MECSKGAYGFNSLALSSSGSYLGEEEYTTNDLLWLVRGNGCCIHLNAGMRQPPIQKTLWKWKLWLPSSHPCLNPNHLTLQKAVVDSSLCTLMVCITWKDNPVSFYLPLLGPRPRVAGPRWAGVKTLPKQFKQKPRISYKMIYERTLTLDKISFSELYWKNWHQVYVCLSVNCG